MKYPVNFEIEFKKNIYPGKFIALEGLDGSGKTTQAQLLCDNLAKKGIEAVYTKEPTDEPTGRMIRQVLAGQMKMTPVALQYLFNADRAVHLEEITKLLKEGKYVITDRYFWSSVAYGVSDLGVIDDYYFVAFSMLSFYNRFLKPDMTFYLRVSPSIGSHRIEEMGKRREIYDHEAKLKKIKKGYEFLLNKFPDEFTIINAERPIEEVNQEMLEYILRG